MICRFIFIEMSYLRWIISLFVGFLKLGFFFNLHINDASVPTIHYWRSGRCIWKLLNNIFISKFSLIWSITLCTCSIVPCFLRKPNWWCGISYLSGSIGSNCLRSSFIASVSVRWRTKGCFAALRPYKAHCASSRDIQDLPLN